MRYKDKHQLAAEWQTLLECTHRPPRQAVERLGERHCGYFVDRFYSVMLEDPHASLFLSNDQVEQRLHPSMQRWLSTMFAVEHVDLVARGLSSRKKLGRCMPASIFSSIWYLADQGSLSKRFTSNRRYV